MNLDTEKMTQYADFLVENSRQIVNLCNQLEANLMVAIQCMDQMSGKGAAMRMAQNLENIKANVPVNDELVQRLVLAKSYVNSAVDIFGR